MHLDEDGVFVGHYPCFNCSSSNALSVYQKENDKGEVYVDGYCFSCQTYSRPRETAEHIGKTECFNVERSQEQKEEDLANIAEIQELDARGVRERLLKKKYCQMYGMRVSYHPETGDIDTHYYPLTKDGEIVGYKVRELPKTFRAVGDTKKTQLFGESLFSGTGEYANKINKKFVMVTEGELDAIALQQMLSENGDDRFMNAVVSLPNGANGKAVRQSYDFLNSFENVILVMDQDAPGKEAAVEIAKTLPVGRCKIASFSEKDACEMLKKGKSAEMSKIMWTAQPYSPVGVASLGQLWDEYENQAEDDIIGLPSAFGELSGMLGGGIAGGEVTVIGALTSVGKSTILNNIVYHAAFKENRKAGLVYLESSPKEIIDGMLSIHIEENLSLKKHGDKDMPALKKEFQDMVGEDDKLMVVNHNGSFRSVDEMLDKVRWLIKAGGCEMVVIDPLQAAVPSNDNNVIDEFMDSLLKLAKETGACLVVVAHCRKPSDDNPHGVSEYSLKGSSSINQIAFNTLLISRDKVNDNPNIKNTTKLTLVKCRRTGMTGNAGWLKYDNTRAKLIAATDPYVDDEINEDMEFFAEQYAEESVDEAPWAEDKTEDAVEQDF